MIPILILIAVPFFGMLFCFSLDLIEDWVKNKNKKLKEEIKELKKQISEAEVLVAEVVETERPKALTESKVKYVKGLILQEEKEDLEKIKYPKNENL